MVQLIISSWSSTSSCPVALSDQEGLNFERSRTETIVHDICVVHSYRKPTMGRRHKTQTSTRRSTTLVLRTLRELENLVTTLTCLGNQEIPRPAFEPTIESKHYSIFNSYSASPSLLLEWSLSATTVIINIEPIQRRNLNALAFWFTSSQCRNLISLKPVSSLIKWNYHSTISRQTILPKQSHAGSRLRPAR
jgi:hypothetical protein